MVFPLTMTIQTDHDIRGKIGILFNISPLRGLFQYRTEG
jgi:hypothetical protein